MRNKVTIPGASTGKKVSELQPGQMFRYFNSDENVYMRCAEKYSTVVRAVNLTSGIVFINPGDGPVQVLSELTINTPKDC